MLYCFPFEAMECLMNGGIVNTKGSWLFDDQRGYFFKPENGQVLHISVIRASDMIMRAVNLRQISPRLTSIFSTCHLRLSIRKLPLNMDFEILTHLLLFWFSLLEWWWRGWGGGWRAKVKLNNRRWRRPSEPMADGSCKGSARWWWWWSWRWLWWWPCWSWSQQSQWWFGWLVNYETAEGREHLSHYCRSCVASTIKWEGPTYLIIFVIYLSSDHSCHLYLSHT